MYHQNSQSIYQQNMPYQQSLPHQVPRPFQQQQFGPRFQAPQQLTPPRSFYQPPSQHQEHPRPSYPVSIQQQPFYQAPNQNFDQSPKPSYQPPVQNFDNPLNPPYPPPSGPGYNQHSIPPFRNPEQTYEPPAQNYNQPPIQNYNQPPPPQNYNQSSVQNYNQPPIQNFNHPTLQNYNPPSLQNFNQPTTPPYPPTNTNCRQPINSPYQSPNTRFGPLPNTPYQPQIQSPQPFQPSHQLPTGQRFQPPPSFNALRHDFNNSRPHFRPPGQQRFPFKPRYQQPQHDNTKFQFHSRQQSQNFRPTRPYGFNYHQNSDIQSNNMPKKDKPQIACEMGDCDFVGPAGAVREHQNLHHRLGLHKKVLYSNNSDAVKNWIEERKKKWPTKENIQIKLEVEDEKSKRGERIGDEDFHRFYKNNRSNRSGSGRINNRKRPRNNNFIELVEEPMNGNLKRFAGINDIQIEEQKSISLNDELGNPLKPTGLKLLEEYDASSDNESSDEPPEEAVIIKESVPLDNTNSVEVTEEPNSSSEFKDILIESNEKICPKLSDVDKNDVNNDEAVKSYSKELKENEKRNSEHGQKRKKPNKKESKPIKKVPPPRTPRTEVMEKKSALLEALIGDLMRSERNAITQCICYIRNNMHRFCKIQAA